ncbi:hypothetical protein KC332_g3031 [Hortaea werneckii]|uniref:5'-3' DNA helicase ZGRF1-like N-terminal domain-containing protein n=2 Tax=Hortaea werneckii TaxID=91943 RepID=A0A3M7GTT1_HORWE|nr:hypothetical protein KC358_g12695 [Hortaea werneckii]OTA39407.1 hypothetical protein BTJ68_00597 [Hortaea werneckii EXF-2000]KAI6849612.1 hypothetical protein KC350_g2498 [Hortaea werneckii]KAI6939563.1 hypothetical protein KC341_g4067 [Hortaea werneckii]KAI6942377.1 hypothetical protein KC348_g4443 [Hortaea werneckii]
MTAAATYRNTPSLGIPQSQNTALVLEFNCLYTHDVRRKSKRWQDGFLRYHTFNKRVMVYDVPRNFIGDTHWTASELQDGDELTLDKEGVIVQVAEAVGKTETDLTDLRKSKKKPVVEHASSPPALAPAPQTPVGIRGFGSTAARAGPTQLKHRSLNALLGTPKGPVGKATLPAKSPFELRHKDASNIENEHWEAGRPPKRQRIEKQNISSAAPGKETPLWARTNDARQRNKQPVQAQDVIDLREDEPDQFLPGFSSDALVPPSSPVREVPAPKEPSASESSFPAFEKQKTPEHLKRPSRRKLELSESRTNKEGSQVEPTRQSELDGASAGTASRRCGPDVARTQTEKAPEAPSSTKHVAIRDSPYTEGGATLRFASSAPKKKTLLCQDQLTSKPKRIPSTGTDLAADRLLDATSDQECGDRTTVQQAKSQRQVLDERLAKIRKKELKAREKALQEERQDLPARPPDSTGSASCGEVPGKAEQRTGFSPEECPLPTAQQCKSNASGNAPEHSPISQPPPGPAGSETAKTRLQQINNDLRKDDKVCHDLTGRTDPPEGGDTPQEPALQHAHKSAPKRKKVGIGRKEIRESASSCYRRPDGQEHSTKAMNVNTDTVPLSEQAQSLISTEGQPDAATKDDMQLPALKEDRQFQRVVSDPNNHGGPKQRRTPGAPMRITPSPSKQDFPHKQRPQPPSVADVNGSQRTSPQAPTTAQNRPTEAHIPPTDARATPPPPQQKKFIQPLPRPTRSTVRLNTSAEGTATVMLNRPFQPPQPPAVSKAESAEAAAAGIPTGAAEPWSREAFDLFEWRPPNWDEERWCFKD